MRGWQAALRSWRVSRMRHGSCSNSAAPHLLLPKYKLIWLALGGGVADALALVCAGGKGQEVSVLPHRAGATSC